ncbi:MAG: protein kinase, partial [Deltaproteobacteria bacterium]|nr:protein kinase [Deltaproteobacteria bacterium]
MNAKPHCLRGRYRILKHLTRGGTAEILLAEDLEKPSTKVAIKTLRKEFSYDGAFIRMLRSEFDTLSELSHPNIIAAHEYFSEGNNHYLVLEFVDGWNLQDILFFLRKTQSL